MEQVELALTQARGLGDEQIDISADSIVVPLNTPFLLQGSVRNESQTIVSHVLFRVFVDDRMTDQKILRDMESGEERPFETSISIPSKEFKKVYIRLYNISGVTPLLIYEREWNIIIQNNL